MDAFAVSKTNKFNAQCLKVEKENPDTLINMKEFIFLVNNY